jgi:hypothetical protein
VVAADAYSASGTVDPSRNAALLPLMVATKEWGASWMLKGHVGRINVHSKANIASK